ncbi:LodA/GoxA family CTQ-dependent oxidase [Burkholderia arboris]|uniref:LodA/GoxA family CTQ-dependent oxidase n=1 Tax=Burkholderia arboris TaxID=488730 RepID=UPI001CF2482B|nr:LodA/GoxA family CTQ-dependent oxidase [Burkholderia arboris]MCA8032415.1 LodA/GoxA family CTQ-dependent oxidase [Burkholderia arboris]
MTNTKLRIHPAIGFARVGSSEEYYIAPETSAGLPLDGQALTGGLPIKPGTESTPITSSDLRDAAGRLKRQAARFRIYQYDDAALTRYPTGTGAEVVIGSSVDGKVVKDIVWTVHLANKKANCWIMEATPAGLAAYENGQHPPIRNASFASTSDPSNQTRLQKLVIDAGPRAIKASSRSTVPFDKNTRASYGSATGDIVDVPRYPVAFPASNVANLPPGTGSHPITTLGALTTESNGRLLVLGAYGFACGFDANGRANADAPLVHDVDNDNWLDDTGDGPVTAILVFNDGTARAVDSSAWVVSTDPSYAPQTRNIVTLWDEILATWIETFGLRPDIHDKGVYREDFRPSFDEYIFPILRAASLQMWNTNLPATAMKSHDNIDKLTAAKPPFNIMSFIRDPDPRSPAAAVGSPLMPLALGDNQASFLTLTRAQYFFVRQWANGLSEQASPVSYGPGEALDRNVLSNCLGGRFSPGIDLTFIVRDPNLYNPNWQTSRTGGPAVGPFRINMRPLDYTTVSANQPFLGVGYFPLRGNPVEPGDLCKFMAIPWHTDYNSCSTHLPTPNPGGEIDPDGSNVYSGVNTTLYWSWPAQRPVAVYTYDDLVANHGALPVQRYSVRGEGTAAIQQDSSKTFNSPAMNVGRYQNRVDILLDWDKIGFVIQGVAIDEYDGKYPPNYYLEVQSLFKKDYSNLVQPWPNTVTDPLLPPDNS